MVFVYILQSLSTGHYYIGITDHLLRRFNEHRQGENRTTRHQGPWWMPAYEIYESRTHAMQREKQLKAWKSSKAITALINASNHPG